MSDKLFFVEGILLLELVDFLKVLTSKRRVDLFILIVDSSLIFARKSL